MTQPSAESTDTLAISKSAIRRAGLSMVAVLLIAAVAVLVVALVRSESSHDALASAINPDEYQVLFLTNGQEYFGKLDAPGGDFYYLRHVFYVSSQVSGAKPTTGRLRLVKLGAGAEVEGPEDMMVINRRQILYVENLKPSGQVSRLIRKMSGR